MQPGLGEYLPMRPLKPEEIYTQMSPQTPRKPKTTPRKTQVSPPLDITVTLIQHQNQPPQPQPQPPPLPPKRNAPRRSVSLNFQKLREKEVVEEMKTKLQRKEEELLTTWMDLILARKLALQARRQKQKLQILTALLIFLLVCMILSVMLYFLIRL